MDEKAKEKLLEYITSENGTGDWLEEEGLLINNILSPDDVLEDDEDFTFTFCESRGESLEFEEFLKANKIDYHSEREFDGGDLYEMYHINSKYLKTLIS
jgi:hypothetical protein